MRIVGMIILAIAMTGCYEAEWLGRDGGTDADLDTDTGMYWDCDHLCGVEAECSQGDPYYKGEAYCREDCGDAIAELEAEQAWLLDCVFDCGWDYPGDAPAATYGSCHELVACVADCHGE